MEFVLVVPRRDLFADCYPQGFLPFGDGLRVEDFERRVRECAFFVERARAERDPELQQIIPYTIVTRRAPHDESAREVLLLRRTRQGGESRLFDKLSIGVGGHIDATDAQATGADRAAVLDSGTRRELAEELDHDGPLAWRRVGLLNDDSNPVGAVHVGLVQIAEASGRLEIREKDVLEGEFVSPQHLLALHGEGANFETWSARLVERLGELIQGKGPPEARPRVRSGATA